MGGCTAQARPACAAERPRLRATFAQQSHTFTAHSIHTAHCVKFGHCLLCTGCLRCFFFGPFTRQTALCCTALEMLQSSQRRFSSIHSYCATHKAHMSHDSSTLRARSVRCFNGHLGDFSMCAAKAARRSDLQPVRGLVTATHLEVPV